MKKTLLAAAMSAALVASQVQAADIKVGSAAGVTGPIAELVDDARDHVIDKHRASVFFDTNLSTRLRMLGIDTLIIAGCNTEFCVAHTVRDAYARDYEIVVLEDAVAGIEPRFHALCLEMFGAYFAEVMPVGELAAWIEEPSA